jgi:hypothetical protein
MSKDAAQKIENEKQTSSVDLERCGFANIEIAAFTSDAGLIKKKD